MSASSMRAVQAAKERAEMIHHEATVEFSPFSTPVRQAKRRNGIVRSPASGHHRSSTPYQSVTPATTPGRTEIVQQAREPSAAVRNPSMTQKQILVSHRDPPYELSTNIGTPQQAGKAFSVTNQNSGSAGATDFANDPDFLDFAVPRLRKSPPRAPEANHQAKRNGLLLPTRNDDLLAAGYILPAFRMISHTVS